MSNHWLKKAEPMPSLDNFTLLFSIGDNFRRYVRDCIDSGVSVAEFFDNSAEFLELQLLRPEMKWFEIETIRNADNMVFKISYELAGWDKSWMQYYVYDHEWTDPRPINMLEL
jgi:hypothetical protein